jgi:type II secretory pathway component PulK
MATYRELALVMGVRPHELAELRKLATVLPHTVNKVNVNTAPLAVLQALSAEPIDETVLANLHAQRCQQPFLDKADLRARVPEMESMLAQLTYSSAWFRVRSTAHVGDTVQSVEAILFRQGARIDATYVLARRGANIADTQLVPPSTDARGEEGT